MSDVEEEVEKPGCLQALVEFPAFQTLVGRGALGCAQMFGSHGAVRCHHSGECHRYWLGDGRKGRRLVADLG